MNNKMNKLRTRIKYLINIESNKSMGSIQSTINISWLCFTDFVERRLQIDAPRAPAAERAALGAVPQQQRVGVPVLHVVPVLGAWTEGGCTRFFYVPQL